MKYILDTHTLIWFLQGNDALSRKAKSIIEETDSQKYVSIASIWEIAIKLGLEKIVLAKSLEDFSNFTDQALSHSPGKYTRILSQRPIRPAYYCPMY
jgi:PIN domain nuclease of toxin-antitoxin system